MVDLRLLGSTELKDPGGVQIPSVISRPKRLALLTYLVLEDPGAFHRREKLVGLFWEDSDETRARGNLSVVLHHLRRLLGEDVVVKRGRKEVGVSPDALRVDVHEFERTARKQELERAAELYRGPLLDGFHLDGAGEFSRWLENRRHRLHVSAVDVLTSLAKRDGSRSPSNARKWANRAVALAPYAENAQRLQMEVLERSGHRVEALRAYQRFCVRLKEELEMTPSSELRSYAARLRSRDTTASRRAVRGKEDAGADEATTAEVDIESPAKPDPKKSLRVERWAAATVVLAAMVVALVVLAPHVDRFIVSSPRAAAVEARPGLDEVRAVREGGGPERSGSSTAELTPPIRSLAVLPLSAVGDPRDDEGWLRDGMTYALTSELGRISALKVISPSSANRFRDPEISVSDIAQQLGVEALLVGSVDRIGDSVQVSLRMVGEQEGEIWSKRYIDVTRRLFDLQSDIVRDVASRIHVTLTDGEAERLAASPGEVAPEVLGLVLRGDLHASRMSESSLREALDMYLEARALDQDYAPAYAGIASAYVNLGSWHASVSPREALPLARAAAERALALDPGLARAHSVLGYIRFWFEWDWTGAERSFRRALELNPSLASAHIAYAHFLSSRGRPAEALIHGHQAVELDPLLATAYFEAGVAADLAGRPEEAMRLYSRGLELDPASDQGHTVIADFHYIRVGKPGGAIEYLERAQELAENAFTLGLLGYAYGATGSEAKARAALTRIEELRTEAHVSPVSLAYVHLGLGNRDEALDWLETAFAERDMALVWLEEGQVYRPLTDDPRLKTLLAQMGFPE